MSRLSSGQAFSKLEALGNDFVLLDCRDGRADPPPEQIRELADRHTGIGFDQLLILHPPAQSGANAAVSIHNADGSLARQCGNGMRAIGLWLHQRQPGQRHFELETPAGPIDIRIDTPDQITASMGYPDFDPEAVGLHSAAGLEAALEPVPGLLDHGTVSVGNPHLILLLDPAAKPELVERVGRELSTWPGFADGANVSFACIEAPDRVDLKVHERGTGPTRACGSAACAAAAWLLRQGKVRAPLRVEQPGGTLVIDWRGAGHPILMTGPARHVYDGRLG